ncbi:MAG TPA: patatin-like phospholipase family protein [Solirubrobacterales bacterium]
MASQEPSDGIALCLSGGGYRAMLFHVGALWRLNEIGYMAELECVCSVSGGSITAAVLGLSWDELKFDDREIAVNFGEKIVDPIRALAGRTIDRRAMLTGAVPGVNVGDRLAAAYRRHLFGHATLQDLPDQDRGGPEFVIKATNLQSGVLWRFSRARAADYRVGRIPKPKISVATAVAASSAFPPFLGPVRLRFSGDEYAHPFRSEDLHEPPFTTRPTLADGGVYDNLGQEVAWRSCRTVLISDGGVSKADGGRRGPVPWRWRDWATQLLRVLKTVDGQVRSLRKRRALAGFTALPGSKEHRYGTYWGICSDIKRYQLESSLPVSSEVAAELAGVRTRLKKLDDGTQERLINWGYAICDTAIRRWVDDSVRAPRRLPYPDSRIDR